MHYESEIKQADDATVQKTFTDSDIFMDKKKSINSNRSSRRSFESFKSYHAPLLGLSKQEAAVLI